MSEYQSRLYSGDLVHIGTFDAPADGAHFHDSGPIGGYLLVFPGVPVQITHLGGKPIAANPNLVLFYNLGQEYRRDALSPLGDRCFWFGFGADTICDVLQYRDESILDHPHRPFRLTHGPAPAQIYVRQRALVETLRTDPRPDQAFVEERALAILSCAVRSAYQAWPDAATTQKPAWHKADRDIARAVEELLVKRFRDRLTLGDIASEVGYSPFHVSRIFCQQTGQTIHRYLSQLRLRTAYEQILAGADDLSRLAHDLGFSSHSHFTLAFRRSFGVQPSEIRQKSPLKAKESNFLIAPGQDMS
jgi:AraC family transcriptional regulator